MSGTISFPPNPTVGQTYTFNNTTWQWNGTVWTNAMTGANFLPLSGGTLTGPLTLAGNASAALQPAAYQQVSGLIPNNYIDNSGFRVNQRTYASGTALAAGAYGFDRWKGGPAAGGTLTFTTGGTTALSVTISAGSIQQVVEGVNLLSQTYTLSWTGTAQGRIATTSGGGTYAASPIQFSATGNTNAFVEFTGGTLSRVQLQLGSVATTWQQTPFAVDTMRCMRFLEPILSWAQGSYSAGVITQWGWSVPFAVQKRSPPTIINFSATYSNSVNGITWAGASVQSAPFGLVFASAGNGSASFSCFASAEL